MQNKRSLIPVFGALALLALFLKLPEAPNLGIMSCKPCSSENPYFVFIAASYFSLLITVILLVPSFPNRDLARGGLFASILLAGVLTYKLFPNWCLPCIVAHLSHIAIWAILLVTPLQKITHSISGEKICLILFSPLIMATFFASLNLTLLVYNAKAQATVLSGLQTGDQVKPFEATTLAGKSINSNLKGVLHFVAANCPYCHEQLPILDSVAANLGPGYRIINITSEVTEDLQKYQTAEWVADQEGNLRSLFKVQGYPTLFVLDGNGKIQDVILGSSTQLKSQLSFLNGN